MKNDPNHQEHQDHEQEQQQTTTQQHENPKHIAHLVVAFRGTTTGRNHATNADLGRAIFKEMAAASRGQAMVHHGFNESWNLIQPHVFRALDKYLTALQHRKFPVVFTGHSSGAAMSCLCAYAFRREFPSHPCSVYTFGQTRFANSAFRDLYNAAVPETYRVTVENDIVVKVHHCNRVHVGREVVLDRDGNFIVEPNGLEKYYDVLIGVGSGLGNHRLARYARAFEILFKKTLPLPFSTFLVVQRKQKQLLMQQRLAHDAAGLSVGYHRKRMSGGVASSVSGGGGDQNDTNTSNNTSMREEGNTNNNNDTINNNNNSASQIVSSSSRNELQQMENVASSYTGNDSNSMLMMMTNNNSFSGTTGGGSSPNLLLSSQNINNNNNTTTSGVSRFQARLGISEKSVSPQNTSMVFSGNNISTNNNNITSASASIANFGTPAAGAGSSSYHRPKRSSGSEQNVLSSRGSTNVNTNNNTPAPLSSGISTNQQQHQYPTSFVSSPVRPQEEEDEAKSTSLLQIASRNETPIDNVGGTTNNSGKKINNQGGKPTSHRNNKNKNRHHDPFELDVNLSNEVTNDNQLNSTRQFHQNYNNNNEPAESLLPKNSTSSNNNNNKSSVTTTATTASHVTNLTNASDVFEISADTLPSANSPPKRQRTSTLMGEEFSSSNNNNNNKSSKHHFPTLSSSSNPFPSQPLEDDDDHQEEDDETTTTTANKNNNKNNTTTAITISPKSHNDETAVPENDDNISTPTNENVSKKKENNKEDKNKNNDDDQDETSSMRALDDDDLDSESSLRELDDEEN